MRFPAFVCAWSIALLFHLSFYRQCGDGIFGAALAIAAVLSLLQPRSLALLIATCALQLACYAEQAPHVFNHWTYAAFVSVTVLSATGLLAARRIPLSVDAVLDNAAPPLRLLVIGVYAIAAFHKLNGGYFFTPESCAAVHFESLRQKLPAFPMLPTVWLAAFSVATEGFLAIAFSFRASRNVALLVGTVFHVALGLNGFPTFALLMFATYTSFLELNVKGFRLRTVVSFFGFALALFLLGVFLKPGAYAAAGAWKAWHAVLFLGLAFTWLSLLVPSLGGRVPGRAAAFFGGEAFIGALFVLNGLSPYLGLKTLNTFSMYSNLRTEGTHPNHWLLTHGLTLKSDQSDLVEIADSAVPALARAASKGYRLPKQQLHNELATAFVAGEKDLAVSFVHDGRKISLSDTDARRLALAVSPILRKFYTFRPVDSLEQPACTL